MSSVQAGSRNRSTRRCISRFFGFAGIGVAAEIWDVVSDCLVVAAISHDPTGNSLAPYYYAGFGMSCAASLLAIAIKIKLVAFKLRKRSKIDNKRGVAPAAKALFRIEEQLDELELLTNEAVGAVLLAIFEVHRSHLPSPLIPASSPVASLFRTPKAGFVCCARIFRWEASP